VREKVAEPQISVDDDTPEEGQQVTVLAQGLKPGARYTIYTAFDTVQQTADVYGEIRLTRTIPVDAPTGYSVVGISGYNPPTAAYTVVDIQPGVIRY
jgi:hypothetical protein